MIDVDTISDALAIGVANELTNPDFINRTHGTRSCFNAGCDGPLCKKFNRDRQRRLYKITNPVPQRDRRGPQNPEMDQFLEDLIVKHAATRKVRAA